MGVRSSVFTCTAVLNELTENVNNNQIDSVVQSFTNVLFDCTSAAFSRSAHPTNKAKAKMHGLIIIVLKQAITLSRPETSFCATNLIRTEGILFQ